MPIHGGKITALIGLSGCGKSSFLSFINRLDGLPISGKKIDTLNLRRRIGTIFQKPNPFPFSIYKNLALSNKFLTIPKVGLLRLTLKELGANIKLNFKFIYNINRKN